MAWTVLSFGEHTGKTLPQVVLSDPDWFFWAYEEGVFEKKGLLKKEADEIYQKATSIRIPQKASEKKVVEYVIHPMTMKFNSFKLVPESQPKHEGSSPTSRSAQLDLSFPRGLATYDKLGCKHMISSFKFHFFGSEKCRLTKEKCEYFFNDDTNFKK